MSQKQQMKIRKQNLKTQETTISLATQIEFGKPIKLPNIHRKNGLNKSRHHDANRRSIQTRHDELSPDPNKNLKTQAYKEFQMNLKRKFSNNSQLQLLTLDEIQLCQDQSKKVLPKLNGFGGYLAMGSRQSTQRFDRQEFLQRLVRIKSQKNIQASETKNNYKMGSIIGRGNYAYVRLCENNNGKKYAAKVYPKAKLNSNQKATNLQRQIKVLQKLQHPNIIAFKQLIESEQSVSIIMEAFNNTSLAEYLKATSKNNSQKTGKKEKKKITEESAKIIMKQVFHAFQYLHKKNIIHRDIKLQNILISMKDLRVKLIDFGFSVLENQLDEKVLQDYCGTPNYIAPEVIKKMGYLGKPADIWSLGILLFCLVTGSYPFKNVSQKSDYLKINKLNEHELSQQLKLLLSRMLQNRPQSRPTVTEILNFSWLSSSK